jgi:hypothetical protein
VGDIAHGFLIPGFYSCIAEEDIMAKKKGQGPSKGGPPGGKPGMPKPSMPKQQIPRGMPNMRRTPPRHGR